MNGSVRRLLTLVVTVGFPACVPAKNAMRVRTALRILGLSFTEHPAAFVLVTT